MWNSFITKVEETLRERKANTTDPEMIQALDLALSWVSKVPR